MITPIAGGGCLREVYGDLMRADDSVCHCVSACLGMGKGIAVLFKQRFGRVDELKAQGVGVGGVAVLTILPERPPPEVAAASAGAASPVGSSTNLQDSDSGTTGRPPRQTPHTFAYYLITKPRFHDKPTYDTVASSLLAMISHMRANGVTSVSMPLIGCGLDGLLWPRMRAIIVDLFAGTGVQITAYSFKPAQQMRSRDATFV